MAHKFEVHEKKKNTESKLLNQKKKLLARQAYLFIYYLFIVYMRLSLNKQTVFLKVQWYL